MSKRPLARARRARALLGGRGDPWRRGVAVLNYSARPAEIAHPVFRPLLLLREAGFEVHSVTRGDTSERVEVDGVVAWVEPTTVSAARRMASLRGELAFVESSSYGVLFGRLGRRSWIRNPQPASHPHLRRLQGVALRAFDAVSFTNPAAPAQWTLRPSQFVDLAYPVDVEWWAQPRPRRPSWWTDRGWPMPQGPVLVCNAALTRNKRQAEMLDALTPFLRANRGAVLVLVGHAAEPEAAAGLAVQPRALGVGDQVRLTGWVSHDDIRDLWAWASVGIINSASETQCIAIYEALACGVPTLISAIPQLTTQFPNLPAHADGRQLLANLERLLAEPRLREALVESSRPRLAWADIERHDELFHATLARLLGRSDL